VRGRKQGRRKEERRREGVWGQERNQARIWSGKENKNSEKEARKVKKHSRKRISFIPGCRTVK
jgi:hypothetical protein